MNRSRSLSTAVVAEPEGDGRTIPVRLVAWNHPERVTDDGRNWYLEEFTRSGVAPAPGQKLVRDEHSGAVVGHVADVLDLDDGPWAMVRIDDTPAGSDVLARSDRRELGASMEFEDDPTPPRHGQHVRRSHAVFTGLAFTRQPQYTTARVLARRSTPQEPAMSDTSTTPAPAPAPAPAPDPSPAPAVPPASPPPAPVTTNPDDAQHQRSRPAAGPHQLRQEPVQNVGRYRSFGEFVHAATRGTLELEQRGRYFRALSAGALSDVPGLVQEVWINEVIDLMRTHSPATNLFSRRPLPDEGETVNQPKVVQRPDVGVVPEGTQVPSRKIKIGKATWDVVTYGGGQEMSIQSVMRTSPAFLNELYRLYVQAMTLDLEADVAAALLVAAEVTNTAIDIGDTDKLYIDAFIHAAAVIMGQPTIQAMPDAIGMSIAMWEKLAKAKDDVGRQLFTGLNPMNANGRMGLNTPDGQVIDLNYTVIPAWGTTAKVAVVGVKEAFRTMVGPMQTMQADVPETLSKDYAVFEFAAFGAVDEAGMVLIEDPD